MTAKIYLGLDVGERRVGLARGDSIGRIAQPLKTLLNDQTLDAALKQTIADTEATDVVVGRPRNQAGSHTQQTKQVEQFVKRFLAPLHLPIHWQDESVTSIIAEERLMQRKKPYSKADIDAEAASIILQDFLEQI